MDDLLKLVRSYRLTPSLPERLRMAGQILERIIPDLRVFTLGFVPSRAADDVLQEILKAIATALSTFDGATQKAFWAWSYRIARNKIADHFRSQAADRLETIPTEDLWQLIEASQPDAPMSASERLDLEYAMELLASSKPECRDLLWERFVIGLDYEDIAENRSLEYDAVRMRVTRCLDQAKSLLA